MNRSMINILVLVKIFLVLISAGCSSTPIPKRNPSVGTCSKYPIVLHHGFISGRALQWPGAKEALEKKGCRVFSTEVSAAQTIPIRAQQLSLQIEQILQETGFPKVNIITHSMGGLDARYLISSLKYSDRVASLSTVSTPHRGTPLANWAVSKSHELGGQILHLILDLAARLANSTTTFSKVDVAATFNNLKEDYVEREFNPKNPDNPRVYYQSWAGKAVKSRRNVIKSILMDTYDIIFETRGENDGIVPISSSAWGVFRGVIEADHLRLAGHSFDDPTEGSFDQNQFLENITAELRMKGF